MSTRSSYEAGTPCWVDLSSPDPEASKAFYGGLFGWEAADEYDGDQWIYANWTRDGQIVAGLGGQQPEMAGMPPTWSTYVAVDDADEVVSRVADAGGTVMSPTMQVMDAGRMAIVGDPAGAVLSLWEAGDHHGAGVVNEPNSWAWNELLSRDLDASLDFGHRLFGWDYQAMEMPGMTYHVIAGGDEGGLGGLMAMPESMPDQVPSHWNVYVLVDDAQAAVDRATELGGTVAHGPDETPVGILASIQDPQGGGFSIMQPAPQDD